MGWLVDGMESIDDVLLNTGVHQSQSVPFVLLVPYISCLFVCLFRCILNTSLLLSIQQMDSNRLRVAVKFDGFPDTVG